MVSTPGRKNRTGFKPVNRNRKPQPVLRSGDMLPNFGRLYAWFTHQNVSFSDFLLKVIKV